MKKTLFLIGISILAIASAYAGRNEDKPAKQTRPLYMSLCKSDKIDNLQKGENIDVAKASNLQEDSFVDGMSETDDIISNCFEQIFNLSSIIDNYDRLSFNLEEALDKKYNEFTSNGKTTIINILKNDYGIKIRDEFLSLIEKNASKISNKDKEFFYYIFIYGCDIVSEYWRDNYYTLLKDENLRCKLDHKLLEDFIKRPEFYRNFLEFISESKVKFKPKENDIQKREVICKLNNIIKDSRVMVDMVGASFLNFGFFLKSLENISTVEDVCRWLQNVKEASKNEREKVLGCKRIKDYCYFTIIKDAKCNCENNFQIARIFYDVVKNNRGAYYNEGYDYGWPAEYLDKDIESAKSTDLGKVIIQDLKDKEYMYFNVFWEYKKSEIESREHKAEQLELKRIKEELRRREEQERLAREEAERLKREEEERLEREQKEKEEQERLAREEAERLKREEEERLERERKEKEEQERLAREEAERLKREEEERLEWERKEKEEQERLAREKELERQRKIAEQKLYEEYCELLINSRISISQTYSKNELEKDEIRVINILKEVDKNQIEQIVGIEKYEKDIIALEDGVKKFILYINYELAFSMRLAKYFALNENSIKEIVLLKNNYLSNLETLNKIKTDLENFIGKNNLDKSCVADLLLETQNRIDENNLFLEKLQRSEFFLNKIKDELYEQRKRFASMCEIQNRLFRVFYNVFNSKNSFKSVIKEGFYYKNALINSVGDMEDDIFEKLSEDMYQYIYFRIKNNSDECIGALFADYDDNIFNIMSTLLAGDEKAYVSFPVGTSKLCRLDVFKARLGITKCCLIITLGKYIWSLYEDCKKQNNGIDYNFIENELKSNYEKLFEVDCLNKLLNKIFFILHKDEENIENNIYYKFELQEDLHFI